jgi:hypothetical protein
MQLQSSFLAEREEDIFGDELDEDMDGKDGGSGPGKVIVVCMGCKTRINGMGEEKEEEEPGLGSKTREKQQCPPALLTPSKS